MAGSTTTRIAFPDTRKRDRAAERRRAAREIDQRQIDLEDWIAAAKAREAAH